MKNEIVKIETNQLDEVVKGSGLAVKESDEIKSSYLPFLSQLAEIQGHSDKINFESPEKKDELIARELRLSVVKIRTGAEKLKDERKKMYLLRGNLEQASYNLIATSCKLTEEIFFNVEKQREINERKRIEKLRLERLAELQKYSPIEPVGIGEMTDDVWESYLLGQKTAYEARIEAERKAEEERIAKEKADAEEREKQRLENIRLKKEAEERERLAEIERKKAEAEKKKLEEKIRKEREERERLEAEIQAKKDAEQKAKKEEIRKQKEAERKARNAPDKEKLLAFGQSLNDLPRPEIKSIEAAPIMTNINVMLAKLDKYIIEKANEL